MTQDEPMPPEGEAKKPTDDEKGKGKSVSWAPDVKVKEEAEGSGKEKQKALPSGSEGIAGKLEVYKSGAVKIRFGEDIVMDVCISPAFTALDVHFPSVYLFRLQLRRSPHSSSRSCMSTYRSNGCLSLEMSSDALSSRPTSTRSWTAFNRSKTTRSLKLKQAWPAWRGWTNRSESGGRGILG